MPPNYLVLCRPYIKAVDIKQEFLAPMVSLRTPGRDTTGVYLYDLFNIKVIIGYQACCSLVHVLLVIKLQSGNYNFIIRSYTCNICAERITKELLNCNQRSELISTTRGEG